MASEGQGAPRSRQSGAAEGRSATGPHLASSLRARRRDRRPDRTRMLRLLHTADVHLGARHADLGDAAAAQRERQFAAFKAAVDLAIEREGRPLPRRRRPVRLQHPAAPLGRAGRRGARAASSRRRSAASSSPAPTTVYDRASIYRAYDLKAHGRQHARRRPRHGDHAGPARAPPADARRDDPRHGLRDEARPVQPAPRRPRRFRDGAASDVAHRRRPRRARDPGPDGPRRGRRHEGGDRGERPRLPRAGPLALDPEGQGRRRRPTPTRARRSPSPSTRTAPARSSSSRSTMPPAGRASRSRRRRSGGRRSSGSTSTRRGSAASRT